MMILDWMVHYFGGYLTRVEMRSMVHLGRWKDGPCQASDFEDVVVSPWNVCRPTDVRYCKRPYCDGLTMTAVHPSLIVDTFVSVSALVSGLVVVVDENDSCHGSSSSS